MIEILGGNLDKAFKDLKIFADKTYQQTNTKKHQEEHQIWEVGEVEFDRILAISEHDWYDDWGWWRYAKGSVMSEPTTILTVNGQKMKGWYNEDRFLDTINDYLEDVMECDVSLNKREEREKLEKTYFEEELVFDSLLDYICEEHGVSQPKNVCALAVDLAYMNGMKMSELFQKYQG